MNFKLPKRKHTHVVVIHGANASPKSFNYILENTNLTNVTKVRYFSGDGFYNNLEKLKITIPELFSPEGSHPQRKLFTHVYTLRYKEVNKYTKSLPERNPCGAKMSFR